MRDYKQESHYSQDRKNVTIISMESYVKRIKLSNLESKVPTTRDLESNCSLIVSKN